MVRALDAYAIGFSSCNSTAPMPLELASTDILTGLAGSKNLRMRIGACVTSCLRFSSWCSVQCHSPVGFGVVRLSVTGSV